MTMKHRFGVDMLIAIVGMLVGHSYSARTRVHTAVRTAVYL
jgi:hypothetical protein